MIDAKYNACFSESESYINRVVTAPHDDVVLTEVTYDYPVRHIQVRKHSMRRLYPQQSGASPWLNDEVSAFITLATNETIMCPSSLSRL